MNRKTFMLIPLIILTSCVGGGSKTEKQPSDSTVVERKYNNDIAKFTSPDLAYYDVHAKVKEMIFSIYDASGGLDDAKRGDILSVDTVRFDSLGHIMGEVTFNPKAGRIASRKTYAHSGDGKIATGFETLYFEKDSTRLNMKATRNADGYIAKLERYNGQYDSEFDYSNEYEWSDGKLRSMVYTGWEWGSTDNYEYDERGVRIRETSDYNEEGEVTKTIITYKYTRFDAYGNWIERVSRCKSDSYAYSEETDKEEFVSSSVLLTVDCREIIYAEE